MKAKCKWAVLAKLYKWGQASRINIRFKMITEDQLEQLAIQWHETLTPALSHGEKEEDERLAEEVRRLTKSINPIAN